MSVKLAKQTIIDFQNGRIDILKKDFVANINGEIISLEDFRERLGLIIKIIKIPYNSKQFDKSKFKEIILQNLIEEKLLLAEVNRLGIGIILMIKPNLSLKSSRLIISPLILATKSFFSISILPFWKSIIVCFANLTDKKTAQKPHFYRKIFKSLLECFKVLLD